MPKIETKVLMYGLFSILLGVLLILIALLLEEVYKPLAPGLSVLTKMLEHLGIGFVSIGVIGIIVDLNDWRKYFQERIADTIIQKKFLERLDKSELLNLQTNALKVFFKAENIEREESLLNFLQTKIHRFIGSPYREDFNGRISIDYLEGAFTVQETARYKCRKVGDLIQDKVEWFMQRRSEGDRIDDFRITVEIPNNFFQSPEFKTQYPTLSDPKRTFDVGQNDVTLNSTETGVRYSLSLIDYRGIDGLLVEIFVKYHVSFGHDIVWIMGHPTKGFSVTINYPRDFRMDAAIFGVDQREYNEDAGDGLYILNYDSWMLPTTGLTFHLAEKSSSRPS